MSAISAERLNGGQPLVALSDLWWENSVAHNSAALYLERSPTK